MRHSTPWFLPLAALALSACAPTGMPPAEGLHRNAVLSLEQASSRQATPEQRAALYLDAAREASALLDSPNSGEAAREVYNQSVADLTLLLREADSGALWNRPLTLASGDSTYRLRFAKSTRDGIWDPAYFTSFTRANEVGLKTIDHRNRQDGLGGALVGVRKTDPLEAFSLRVGVTAPVTAVLDFKGNAATLTLIDPTVQPHAQGARHPSDRSPASQHHWRPRQRRLAQKLGRRGAILEFPPQFREFREDRPRAAWSMRNARNPRRTPSHSSRSHVT